LRFCKEWLARHQDEVAKAFARGTEESTSSVTSTGGAEGIPGSKGYKENKDIINKFLNLLRTGDSGSEEVPVQLAEPTDSRESRYAPLALYLQSQPTEQDKVEMTFEEIELLIGGGLPKYARIHRSWWANNSSSHVQSLQWLGAGWRVSAVSMTSERVTFTRIKEREQAYIEFYSALLSELRDLGGIPVRTNSADGTSWVVVTRLAPEGEAQLSIVGFSFARGGAFRVELYIDQGDKEANKKIFDNLHRQREAIESKIGEELSWERLDQRRASRVAAYRPGSITDDPEELAELRAWAAPTIVKFYEVFKSLISRPATDGAYADGHDGAERVTGQTG
jgi:hypothetical protein